MNKEEERKEIVRSAYNIGKRDSLAELFMLVRDEKGNVKKVIKELVEQYLKIDSEHPHAKWVKENI